MSVKPLTFWLGLAVVLGLLMRALAALAGDLHAGQALLDVVNWGALWIVVPVLAGRNARRFTIAALAGVVVAAVEIVVYYGEVPIQSPAKLAWLAAGPLVSGCVAVVSYRTRDRVMALCLVSAAFVLEPTLVLGALTAMGRRPWSTWHSSALAEITVGMVGFSVVLARHRLRLLSPPGGVPEAPRRDKHQSS